MKKRNGAIDFYKFIFALLIMMYHSRFFARSEQGMFIGGSIAVEFFFIVSGFLMASSASRRSDELSLASDTVNFMKRKFFSLIPDMYLAWGIGFIVKSVAHDYPWREIVRNLISSVWDLLLLNQTGITGYRVNFVSWYLSAMFLAMTVLYALLRRYKNFFLFVIAPMATVLIYGILFQAGTLRSPSIWYGFVFKGVLRALAGLCLGCLCYNICEKLKTIRFRTFPRIFFSIIEVTSYGAVIVFSFNHGGSSVDYVLVLLFAIGITISFSKQAILSSLYDQKLSYWLGSFSVPLFFGHGFWSQTFSLFFPDKSYTESLPLYIGVSIATGLFIMLSSTLLKDLWHRYARPIKSLFIRLD